jgi:hypothetical protein
MPAVRFGIILALAHEEEALDHPAVRTVNLRAEEPVLMATSHVLTLCEVIQAVSEVAAHEQETLATVVHLISSGQVRLSADAIKALRELSVTTNAAA